MYEHINVLYIYFYLLFRICNLSTGKQTESTSENKVTEQFSTAGIYTLLLEKPILLPLSFSCIKKNPVLSTFSGLYIASSRMVEATSIYMGMKIIPIPYLPEHPLCNSVLFG